MTTTRNTSLGDAPPRRSPLHDFHLERGGKMVTFAGWQLPLSYATGIMGEHNHTRAAASLFDVSHMLQVKLVGKEVERELERVTPGNIAKLPTGAARYAVMTSEDGGIVDDFIVTNCGDYLYFVGNASRREADLAHLNRHLSGVGVEEMTDYALLALQGPSAVEVLARWVPQVVSLRFMHSATFALDGISVRISRLGYTGEDGVEISLPSQHAARIANLLCADDRVQPAGLGARDSLRLEACLMLYGNDIDETTSPIEADLAWLVTKRRRTEGNFLGASGVLQEYTQGAKRRLVAIAPEGRAPARRGVIVRDDNGRAIGSITSGGFSPTLHKPIALGYVESAASHVGSALWLEVRKQMVPAHVVAAPFVPHRYRR